MNVDKMIYCRRGRKPQIINIFKYRQISKIGNIVNNGKKCKKKTLPSKIQDFAKSANIAENQL